MSFVGGESEGTALQGEVAVARAFSGRVAVFGHLKSGGSRRYGRKPGHRFIQVGSRVAPRGRGEEAGHVALLLGCRCHPTS